MRSSCLWRAEFRARRVSVPSRGCGVRGVPTGHDPASAARSQGGTFSLAKGAPLMQYISLGFRSLSRVQMDPIVSLHYYAPVCAIINLFILPFSEGLEPFYALHRIGLLVLFSNAAIAFALNVRDTAPIPRFSLTVVVLGRRCLPDQCRIRAYPHSGWSGQGYRTFSEDCAPLAAGLCHTVGELTPYKLLITGAVLAFGSQITALQVLGYS